MSNAQSRTRRNAATVAREMRASGGGSRLVNASMRPPSSYLARSLARAVALGVKDGLRGGARSGGARGGARARGSSATQRPVGNKGGVTFHFKMGQTGSVGAARAHQSYIERDAACVASFGNIDESYEERCRLWKALGDRCIQRRGCIRVTEDADDELKKLVQRNAQHWAEEGRIPPNMAHQIARLGTLYWKQKTRNGKPREVKIWTVDTEDHDAFMTKLKGSPGQTPDRESNQRHPLPKGTRV